MMTYKKLYHRIRESTGLDVLTENVLQTIIENCFADITSRGYREFGEQIYIPEKETDEDMTFESLGQGLYCIDIPEDYRRTLHLKVTVNNKVYLGYRLALTDERVNSIVVGNDGKDVRSNFAYIDKDVIFYTKDNKMYIETRYRDKEILDIRLGYDKRLIAPEQPTIKEYDDIEIKCRREFEDAIVLFGIYFLLQRYSKDTDRVQIALNNYKYYVEDLTYTLAYEDNYTDEDGIICLERV